MALFAAACSREARHRVLVFLYDGVPPLDDGLALEPIDVDALADLTPSDGPTLLERTRQQIHYHKVYRENECGGCHDVETGRLLRTVRDGLCQLCHKDKPKKREFVHGPMAVNGCLACHRYHKSLHPKLLRTDEQSICLFCHAGELKIKDEHHATMETKQCVDCHDAHGGDDRFFLIEKLKPDEPTTEGKTTNEPRPDEPTDR